LFSADVLRVIYVVCGGFLVGLGVVFGMVGVKGLRGAEGKSVKTVP